MKKCSKCKESKKKSDFYRNIGNGSIDELHSWCKKCCRKDQNLRATERRIREPEKIKLVAKAWRDSNRERYRQLQNQYHARRRLKILSHYSNGIPKCKCCGEKEIQFLTIDHID